MQLMKDCRPLCIKLPVDQSHSPPADLHLISNSSKISRWEGAEARTNCKTCCHRPLGRDCTIHTLGHLCPRNRAGSRGVGAISFHCCSYPKEKIAPGGRTLDSGKAPLYQTKWAQSKYGGENPIARLLQASGFILFSYGAFTGSKELPALRPDK